MSDETSYLQDELRKAERTTRIATIAMSVVLVVFIAYFQWMKSALAEVLQPPSVAEFVVNEARGALPGITSSLKQSLSGEAPEVVHFVMHQAIDQVLPLAAQSFQTNLDEYSRDVNKLAMDKVTPAFSAVIKQFKTKLYRPKHEDRATFAARFSSYLEAELGNQLDAAARDGVKDRLDHSGETLKHINAELISMSQHPSGDREGELGRRLITTWWTFLDRGRPGDAGREVAANTKPRAAPANAR